MGDVTRAVGEIRTMGFTVVPNVIPADCVDGVRESVLRTVQQHGRDSAPEGIGFVPGLVAHDQSFLPYLTDDRLLSTVEELLGALYRVSFTSAIVNEPGNSRGGWHADWPFNQNNAGHVSVPYPDGVFHLTTLWMISPFREENGGTLVLPSSHRSRNNPTGENGYDPLAAIPGERHAFGDAGSVLVMDSRLWHATAPNLTGDPRVALAIRFAPWWLDLDVLRPGSDSRRRMVEEAGARENEVPPVPRDVFDRMEDKAKALFRHWVAD